MRTCAMAFQHRTQTIALKLLLFAGSLSSVYLDDPLRLHSTGVGAAGVRGVTCLGDDVFVVREGVAEVEVYDVRLSLKRRFTVVGLAYPYDVKACAKNNRLYICDRVGKCVYRVELNGNATNWQTKTEPRSLSVTPKYNILVTMLYNDASRPTLNEFTLDGQLVREINLKPDVSHPVHAVQLPSGQLLVCHIGSQHRVCKISDDGSVVQFYGGQPGSGTGQLLTPHHLVVDKQGFILVVDSNNDRVVLLNSALTFVKEVISANRALNHSIYYSISLFLDELRGLLYVGEYDGKQVSVFRVNDIKTI